MLQQVILENRQSGHSFCIYINLKETVYIFWSIIGFPG